MSIPNYLAKIKSSGVYRYVFDKSEIPAEQRDSIRLVVGYSERGPFNTPVYIADAQEFINTYGNISRRMERKGIFFHRMALQALEAGPILALNIKPFKNESVKMISFNASDIKCAENMDLERPADSITLTPEYKDADANWVTEFNKTLTGGARHFYKPVPDYIKKGDKFEFVGSNWAEGTYDDKNKKNNITAGPTHIRTIEKGVEVYWTAAGKVNLPKFEEDGTFVPGSFEYDHVFYNQGYVQLKDKKITVSGLQKDQSDYIEDSALVALDGTNTAGERWTTVYDTNRFWKVTDNLMNITPLVAGGARKKDYMRIVQTSSKEDSVTIFMRPFVPSGYNIKIADWYSAETAEEMPAYMESLKDHYLSEFFMEIYVFKGDFRSHELFTKEGTLGANIRDVADPSNSTFYPFCYVNSKASDQAGKYDNKGKGVDTVVRTNPDFLDPFGRPADALDYMSDCDTANFIGKYQGIMFPSFKDTSGSFISIDSVFNEGFAAHKCLMALNEQLLDDAYEADLDNNLEYNVGTEQTPTEPESSGPNKDNSPGSPADLLHQLTSAVHSRGEKGSGASYDDYDPVQSIPANASVVGYYLEGYRYSTIQKNESGQSLIEDKIYNVLGYKGIYEALTNSVDVDYKYFIDTFQGYPGLAMKSIMSSIVKKKFNALGILNFPPMVDCAVYMGYPGLTGGFDMKDVVKRGSGITLPAEVQGASWVAFYTQLQMTDGTNKFIAPSAALVSNLFMQKRAKRQPYTIVAGPNYGRIVYPGVIGPDYNYAKTDLDQLEPFGVNAIVYIPRKGVVINSNQTAKQTPVTALSKVHVRELVTFIQDEIENMLRGYQWELNTSTLRDNIRAKADVILGLCQANGGIYAFRTQCDDQNNPPEVIDNEMVVLDVEIEPARGAGKMVQTLTIHRTGGIAATPRS